MGVIKITLVRKETETVLHVGTSSMASATLVSIVNMSIDVPFVTSMAMERICAEKG